MNDFLLWLLLAFLLALMVYTLTLHQALKARFGNLEVEHRNLVSAFGRLVEQKGMTLPWVHITGKPAYIENFQALLRTEVAAAVERFGSGGIPCPGNGQHSPGECDACEGTDPELKSSAPKRDSNEFEMYAAMSFPHTPGYVRFWNAVSSAMIMLASRRGDFFPFSERNAVVNAAWSEYEKSKDGPDPTPVKNDEPSLWARVEDIPPNTAFVGIPGPGSTEPLRGALRYMRADDGSDLVVYKNVEDGEYDTISNAYLNECFPSGFAEVTPWLEGGE